MGRRQSVIRITDMPLPKWGRPEGEARDAKLGLPIGYPFRSRAPSYSKENLASGAVQRVIQRGTLCFLLPKEVPVEGGGVAPCIALWATEGNV